MPDILKKRSQKAWDKYFHNVCETVSSKSPCLSRQIGAILVRDHSIISTGYNGPPRGIPHCGHERILEDQVIYKELYTIMKTTDRKTMGNTCPRQLIPNYVSGKRMELCPAQHAEENCVSNAARIGVITYGATLYMNSIIPCHRCFGTLINAGIKEIVIDKIQPYDDHTIFLTTHSDIKIRSFRHDY